MLFSPNSQFQVCILFKWLTMDDRAEFWRKKYSIIVMSLVANRKKQTILLHHCWFLVPPWLRGKSRRDVSKMIGSLDDLYAFVKLERGRETYLFSLNQSIAYSAKIGFKVCLLKCNVTKTGFIILQNYLSCCREFADPVVAEATLEFLIINKKKLLTSFPNLLPQV